MRRDANLIGRKVARLRYQQGLTQDMLVAKLEVLKFFGITRDVLSNIELQKYVATDKHICFRQGIESGNCRTLSTMSRRATGTRKSWPPGETM